MDWRWQGQTQREFDKELKNTWNEEFQLHKWATACSHTIWDDEQIEWGIEPEEEEEPSSTGGDLPEELWRIEPHLIHPNGLMTWQTL